jgi:hypothetical protein
MTSPAAGSAGAGPAEMNAQPAQGLAPSAGPPQVETGHDIGLSANCEAALAMYPQHTKRPK